MAFLPYGACRRVAARCVVLVGMLALTATSEPDDPSFFVAARVEATFEVPPNGAVTRRFVLRVEGHPVLVGGRKLLVVDGSGAPPLPAPFSAADAGSPSPLLPLVAFDGRPVAAQSISETSFSGKITYPFYEPRCTSSDVCELEIAVTLTAEDAPRTTHLVLTAGVHQVGHDEPPPGRVTFAALEASP